MKNIDELLVPELMTINEKAFRYIMDWINHNYIINSIHYVSNEYLMLKVDAPYKSITRNYSIIINVLDHRIYIKNDWDNHVNSYITKFSITSPIAIASATTDFDNTWNHK